MQQEGDEPTCAPQASLEYEAPGPRASRRRETVYRWGRNVLLFAFATTLVVAVGAWVLWPAPPPTRFSAQAWQNTPETEREAMAKDFIANHFRQGMPRAELIALLGNSDPGFPQELQYIVGKAMIDSRVLWVRLDKRGRAVSASIYQTS